MLYLDRLASNVLKPSQSTRKSVYLGNLLSFTGSLAIFLQGRIHGFGANSESPKTVC